MPSQKQGHGPNPIATRETDQYQLEYIQNLVAHWDELIDWEARTLSEGQFFIKSLQERGANRVLDVATGTGFHSVSLLQNGFEVVSVDGSMEMLTKAFSNARQRGFILRTIHTDWRWLNREVHEQFDAVICLGNSFTHLFSEKDRRKALAEFYAALNYNGVLILDQRNYEAILEEGCSPTKPTYYYCGENVKVEPEYMDEGLARFRYGFSDQSVFHINMYPLRQNYVRELMMDVGFQRVKTYGDFKDTYHHEKPDFFIHIAEKEYKEGEEEDPN